MHAAHGASWMETVDIQDNVRLIRDKIRLAAQRTGRSPDHVHLMAVTKSVPVQGIRQAVEAGATIVGENRLQEAIPKMELIGRRAVQWHFIGRLQRRKVKMVVGSFNVIHSVDSIELATEIDRRAGEAGLRQTILLEVNLGGEPSKAGFAPSGVEHVLRILDEYEHIAINGLMTIPPRTREPETARPYFRALRDLAVHMMRPAFRRIRMEELSMGMSHDYEVAVEEGATLVRVGTAIFGARPERTVAR